MKSGGPEIFSDVIPDAQSNGDKACHDVRASLAITSGFSEAMESSFSEFCTTLEQILCPIEPRTATDRELRERLQQLEADCRFCLSRMHRSLEKLDDCINSKSGVGSGTHDQSRLNKP